MKMKSWISHDWKPITINVLHPLKMCSTSTLWWMNRDMIRNINWVGNIKKIGYLISFICNYIDLNVFVSLLISPNNIVSRLRAYMKTKLYWARYIISCIETGKIFIPKYCIPTCSEFLCTFNALPLFKTIKLYAQILPNRLPVRRLSKKSEFFHINL